MKTLEELEKELESTNEYSNMSYLTESDVVTAMLDGVIGLDKEFLLNFFKNCNNHYDWDTYFIQNCAYSNAYQDPNFIAEKKEAKAHNKEILEYFAKDEEPYILKDDTRWLKDYDFESEELYGTDNETIWELYSKKYNIPMSDLPICNLFSDKDFTLEILNLIAPYSTEYFFELIPENTMKNILLAGDTLYKASRKNPNILRFVFNKLKESETLLNDEDFVLQFFMNLDNSHLAHQTYDIAALVASTELFENKEFNKKVMHLMEANWQDCLYDYLLECLIPTEELAKDEELALMYCNLFQKTNNKIDKSLLENRDFLEKILDSIDSYVVADMADFTLPKKFWDDKDIVEKYLRINGNVIGLNFELMKLDYEKFPNMDIDYFLDNMDELKKDRFNLYNEDSIIYNIISGILETGSVVTHFGDDLDNKASIEALQRWAEYHDIIRIGEPLKVIRVPAGQIKEGYLNIDTGGHKGSRILEDGTVIIDGDPERGVQSAVKALSKLDVYVPEQILELADTKPNKVSALDSRSAFALTRYLTGSQVFELAERELLDKQLTDEQLAEFNLTEAHTKQQQIIDAGIEKIKKYTISLPNGEKLVLAPEQILAGTSIAYELGINYYASVSQHLDSDKNVDGITFAITSKPGIELPEGVINFGNKLVEEYRIDENSSGVFVSPDKQMIVAGGNKNPNFKIPNTSVDEMLDKIERIFIERKLVKQILDKREIVNDQEAQKEELKNQIKAKKDTPNIGE